MLSVNKKGIQCEYEIGREINFVRYRKWRDKNRSKKQEKGGNAFADDSEIAGIGTLLATVGAPFNGLIQKDES